MSLSRELTERNNTTNNIKHLFALSKVPYSFGLPSDLHPIIHLFADNHEYVQRDLVCPTLQADIH